jgi:hypothetical protein
VPRTATVRSAALRLALVAGLLVPAGAQAADEGEPPPDEGRFVVHTAYTELIDGVYHLNADVEFSLDQPALKALESSLPLTIKFEIEIIRDRRFIWDETVARLEHVDVIAYHPLSQRYLVRELATGEVESFASYRAAVARLGQVSDVPLIDQRLLDENARYRVRVRALMDLSEYSAPLRVYASFWQDWTIQSDWYEWVLR